ncbi:hypothetical protein EXS70_00505 [Candidatus Peribacteria bacterium]|nr:hypothetical protein [Candidatus Peribacteria bacterium]
MFYETPQFFLILWPFILLLSTVTALMEIQIEGGNGWASCLPSWRFSPKWLRKLMNGKEVTGYHIYFNLHMIVLLHLPLLLAGWSWPMELTILFVLCTTMLLEDFLWFVFNPHFGWQSFFPGKIPWYTHWFGAFPVDYYFWVAMSAFLAGMRGLVIVPVPEPTFGTDNPIIAQLAGWGIGFFACLVVMLAMVLICTPRIRRYLITDTDPHPGHPGFCQACTMPHTARKSAAKKKKKRPSARRKK